MIDLRPYLETTAAKSGDATRPAIAVLGLGRSGLTAALALAKAGATVWAWDDNPQGREKAEAAGLQLVDLTSCDWSQVQSLVMSPGIPLTHPAPHPVAAAAQAAGVEVICEVELLYRAQPDATYVGITGTNGKSTTTSLIGHILQQAGRKAAIGGNLGTPALELEPMGADGIYVLEMSSYQLDLIRELTFDIALLLNVSPDHLDRHGDLAGYVAAKEHIFDRQDKHQAALVTLDDEQSRMVFDRLNSKSRQQVIPLSAQTRVAEGCFVAEGVLCDDLFSPGEEILDLTELAHLPGQHNHQNAVAAFAICRRLGLSTEEIVDGLRSFPGLAHRQELVTTWNGIRFVNDSKATNSDAAARALGSYDNIYWIAGGRAKEGGLDGLEPYYPRIRHAYLIGECAEAFAEQLNGAIAHSHCGTLEVAVKRAANDAQREGHNEPVVLLSPACASWDQYPSFEARGDDFRSQVNAQISTLEDSGS